MQTMNRKYLIVIERGRDGKYGAYVPDLPGCAVVGYAAPDAAKAAVATAIEMHLAGMIEDGEGIPEPSVLGDYVETSVA
jgi:predicted RNase H-like HicB family nuclease